MVPETFLQGEIGVESMELYDGLRREREVDIFCGCLSIRNNGEDSILCLNVEFLVCTGTVRIGNMNQIIIRWRNCERISWAFISRFEFQ
jgi:hypothetical protein